MHNSVWENTVYMNSDIEYLQKKHRELSNTYHQRKGKKESCEANLAKAQEKLSLLSAKEELLSQTNVLLKKIAEYQRRQACQEIEELATHALQRIFGPHMSLQINIKDNRRTRAEAEVVVITNQNDVITVGPPESSHGGGVVNVISVALRLVVMQILDPEIPGPILLDEPTANISSELVQPFHDFLKEVSEKFNRQIILITHQGITNADNAICISQDISGRSYVTDAENRRLQYG